jgi:hypothetical protein
LAKEGHPAHSAIPEEEILQDLIAISPERGDPVSSQVAGDDDFMVCLRIHNHLCQWLPHIFYIIQTKKEETAASLLEYCNVLYRNQAQWLKDKHPLAGGNMTEMHWGNGSHILAVPKGADQVRKHHPYGYFQDESAFLPEAEASFNAVKPVAKQIICVSSAAPGWFGNMSDKNLAVVE